MTAAAIRATFSTYRHVPTRKVIQLVLEVPEEHQQAVFAALGYPLTGVDHWVAVARLTDPADPTPARPPAARHVPPHDEPSPPSEAPPEGVHPKSLARSERAKAWFDGLSPEEKVVANAAMLAKNRAFQAWFGADGEHDAADRIRRYCGVKSRRELATDGAARVWFDTILKGFKDFQIATGRMAEMR